MSLGVERYELVKGSESIILNSSLPDLRRLQYLFRLAVPSAKLVMSKTNHGNVFV